MVDLWMRSVFGSYFQYSPLDTTPADVEYDYFLPDEFDGYYLVREIDRGNDIFYVYSNEQGGQLFFEYVHGSSDTSMYLTDVDEHQYIRTSVHSQPADLYLAPDNDHASVIIWLNLEENALFRIVAAEDADTLIAIAEKVEKIPKK